MQLIYTSNQDAVSDEIIGNEITSDEVVNDDIIDDGLMNETSYRNLIVDPKGAVEQVVYNSIIGSHPI